MRTLRTLSFVALLCSAPLLQAQICDLVEVDTISVQGALRSPLVFGGVGYATAGVSGLAVIDIDDPAGLELIDLVPTRGEARAVTFSYFDQLLVVADGLSGVGVYTIGGDGSLSEVGTTGLGELVQAVGGSSSHFYAGGLDGTLFSMAVSPDEAPTLLGSVELDGPVNDLVVHSRVVYAAIGTAGLAAVSVDDAESPEIVEVIGLGGSVLGVERLGDVLYCGVEGVGVVAVSTAGGDLTVVGSLSMAPAPVELTAWNGRLYLASPALGVAEADVTLPGDPLLLSQLELTEANGLALVGETLFVTRGTSGFTSVDVSDCANAGVNPITSYVPAAAKAEGGFNSDWLTDAAIANLSTATASFNISYLVKGQANLQPMNVSIVLKPAEQLFVRDVFASLFGLEAANGALRIVASHPDVKITTRTYNAAGIEGTYGQYIPAYSRDAAITPGEVAALLQLQQSHDFRTNIGLMNITAQPVDVEIQLYRSSGELVGVVTEALDSAEMTQIDQIYTLIGAGTVESGYALVKVLTDGGAVLSYASVADNSSNDAVFIGSQVLTYEIEFSP